MTIRDIQNMIDEWEATRVDYDKALNFFSDSSKDWALQCKNLCDSAIQDLKRIKESLIV